MRVFSCKKKMGLFYFEQSIQMWVGIIVAKCLHQAETCCGSLFFFGDPHQKKKSERDTRVSGIKPI